VITTTILRGTDYLALPRDPQPWVVRDLVPIGGVLNIFGKPKVGKSYGALQLRIAVASGESHWMGFKVEKAGPVAYIQIDTPRANWAARVETMQKAGLDVSNVFFCDMLMAPYPFNVTNPEHFSSLKQAIAMVQPIMTVVDTLREAHPADENDSTAMKMVINNLVAATQPGALVLVSHSRKEGAVSGDITEEGRGSSYVSGRMDSIIKFTDKRMYYKGRSLEAGNISISQDSETGMLLMDTGDMELEKAIRKAQLENPTATPHAIARMLSKQFDTSVRTIERRIQNLH
jgi:RecA-family ATPase